METKFCRPGAWKNHSCNLHAPEKIDISSLVHFRTQINEIFMDRIDAGMYNKRKSNEQSAEKPETPNGRN